MTAILTNRITPAQFVDKWRPVTLTERSAAHSHFLDLCQMFDHPSPIEMDPTGQEFTFEKGVHKAGGGQGFADVWKRGFFAWEYKKKKRNLDEALGQLSRYALALENPPLQIVCDTERFRIVTAYTNSVPRSYDLSLEELLDNEKRGWLEAAFWDPKKLRPGGRRSDITQLAADRFSTLAQRLQGKGHAPEDIAHFVNRLVFLFFAEDVGLLKEGFFRRTVAELANRPSDAQDLLTGLFRTFQKGGRFGLDRLPWINGGLFDDRGALPLDEHEVGLLKAAGSQDWAHIDPTIFGTLFERFLDPDKRSQIGAHYTDAKKIKQIVEPAILRPLRGEWQKARTEIEKLVNRASLKGAKSKDWQRAEEHRSAFLERLRTLSILDPACGSGNFLYVALYEIKDLEHAINQECEAMGLPPRMPAVGPEILRGIEINPLAAELARTTVWIGDIQWAKQNGIRSRPEPILRKLDNVECRDAVLGSTGTADWPQADVIIGNPPFLGAKQMLARLGKKYTLRLRQSFQDKVSANSDLVCYWFAKSCEAVISGKTRYVGLVATNSIKQKANRNVLQKVEQECRIFDVHSDEKWDLEGAAVRVSLICFENKQGQQPAFLDGKRVHAIRSDLTNIDPDNEQNWTALPSLQENVALAYQGIKRVGQFEIPGDLARNWISKPANADGSRNRDVLRPWISGFDIVRRPQDMWIVDFGWEMTEDEASMYEAPFEHVKKMVKPCRVGKRDKHANEMWWSFYWPRPEMRKSLETVKRYIATPSVAKHRVFRFVDANVVPDGALAVVTREDDNMLGILQSNFHIQWSLRLGSTLEDRPAYRPSASFETYPFPVAPSVLKSFPGSNRVSAAASHPHKLRENWLNPRELIRTQPEVIRGYPDRVFAVNAHAATELKTRTLTNLYNSKPSWLAGAHRELDRAVAAAYGWPEDISTEDALARLLELNRERAAAQGKA